MIFVTWGLERFCLFCDIDIYPRANETNVLRSAHLYDSITTAIRDKPVRGQGSQMWSFQLPIYHSTRKSQLKTGEVRRWRTAGCRPIAQKYSTGAVYSTIDCGIYLYLDFEVDTRVWGCRPLLPKMPPLCHQSRVLTFKQLLPSHAVRTSQIQKSFCATPNTRMDVV